MSLAENLLNTLTTENTEETSKQEEHIVINSSRAIIVPSSISMIGVQLDKDVETREFDCPRYWDDGLDLYGMVFYINYILPNGDVGTYLPYNIRLDEQNSSIIHFSWKIEDYFTVYKGNLQFVIVAKKANANGTLEKRWSSLRNSDLYVAEGIEAENQITTPEQEDVITQILQKIGEGNPLVTVPSEAEMVAILENATDESTKNVYLYTGESGVYEKGAFYIIEQDGASMVYKFTKLTGGSSVEIEQTTGDSETAVMSQKAVTENFDNILSAFEVEGSYNLLDPNNFESGYYNIQTGSPITGGESDRSIRTVKAIPLPSGARTVYISTDVDITNPTIANVYLYVFGLDESGVVIDYGSRTFSDLRTLNFASGVTQIHAYTNGLPAGVTFANICLSVVSTTFEKFSTMKKPTALKPDFIPQGLVEEKDIYESNYKIEALSRENERLNRDLEFMSQRQAGLYDLKSGDTINSQVVTLKSAKKQNLILHIHRYANDGYDTTNDVFLPNAKKNFSDIRITDGNGKVLPYCINKISDLDIVEDSRIHIVGDNMMLKDSKGNLISVKENGICISTDNAETWTKIAGLDGCHSLVAINPDDSLLIAPSESGYLYKSYAPYTLKELVLDCSNYTGVYYGIANTSRLNDGSLLLGAYQLERSIRIYKSTNNGSTWSIVYEDNSGKYQHIHRIYVDRSQGVETIYAGCDGGGGVLKSTDGGASWVDLRDLNPNMPQATDYAVVYSEEDFRLFGGETAIVGGYSLIRTEDDVNFTPVLSVGNHVFVAKKFGDYIVAGLCGSNANRVYGFAVSKDKGFTWDKIYTTSPCTDTAGASDGFRRMDDTIFENTIVAQFAGAGSSRKTVRITAHEDPVYAELIVEVPEGTTSLTVENGYAIGNTISTYSEFEPTNQKLIHYPLNEGGEYFKEAVSGNIYKTDFEYVKCGKDFMKPDENYALLSSLKGFTNKVTLSNCFTISFWDSRTAPTADKFHLVSKGGNYLTIHNHKLLFNDASVAYPLYPVTAETQKVDIVFDGVNKTIKCYANGIYRDSQIASADVNSIINAFVGEGEITMLQTVESYSVRGIQHFTIYDGVLSDEDILKAANAAISDNHQTLF